jgi:hypothetical protein
MVVARVTVAEPVVREREKEVDGDGELEDRVEPWARTTAGTTRTTTRKQRRRIGEEMARRRGWLNEEHG